MTSAAVSSQVAYNGVPQLNTSSGVITYSKANVGDTLNVATKMPGVTSVLFAKASIDASGADDPLTFSGTTITFTTGTGAGRVFVVGA